MQKIKKIFKYPLLEVAFQKFYLPIGYEVLKIALQEGIPTMWVLVSTEQSDVEVELNIFMYGSGHPMEKDLTYIDTVLMENGLVWHFFGQ